MASYLHSLIKFSAVLKGYHIYRNKLTDDILYKCVPEPDNCLDRNAVAIKSSSDEVVGHVPATPIKLNVAILQIFMLDETAEVHCRATGAPRVSQYPWPEQHSKGGGAILPAEYQVSIPLGYEQDVIHLIEHEYSKFPALKETLKISIERPGERTPPMTLSDDPDMPDTPAFSDVTP